MTRLGQPVFQGKASYRYHSREERCAIQSLMLRRSYVYPDTTSLTIFSNGSDGVADMEIHALSREGKVKQEDTPSVLAAHQWLDDQLELRGIKRITKELSPESVRSRSARPAEQTNKPKILPDDLTRRLESWALNEKGHRVSHASEESPDTESPEANSASQSEHASKFASELTTPLSGRLSGSTHTSWVNLPGSARAARTEGYAKTEHKPLSHQLDRFA